MRTYRFTIACLGAAFIVGCGGSDEGPVDFGSEGAELVRQRVCSQDWETAARKGTGAETYNASTVWSVSPYQLLVPSTGEGFVSLNVDAPHYDWLLYTTSDVRLTALDGPDLAFNGSVRECPELDLVEYGVHHQELVSWLVRVDGAALARAKFYAGLAATPHSDPDEAGHAGHDLSGDGEAPDHGGH